MDARQYALELRSIMRAATWPSGAAEKILGNRVYVVAEGIEEEEIPAPPFALLSIGNYTADEKDPGLVTQEFDLSVVVQVFGDRLGESAVLGGPRTGDVMGSSLGRGVLDVSRGLLQSVRDLTGADGLPVQGSLGSGAQIRRIGESSLVGQHHVIRAVCTVDPEYMPVPWFTATKSGSNVDLAWALPAVTGAFRRVVIRYATGSTAPASASAGTAVYTGTGTSKTHTPTSFPASYSIFAAYTDTGAEEDQAYSENERHSQRTVAA